MTRWMTAAEIARASLPGLPTTRFRAQMRAEADGWLSRPREGRGGGMEYHVDSLPEAARKELARRQAISDARLACKIAANDPATVKRGRGRPAGTGGIERNPDMIAAIAAVTAGRSLSSAQVLQLLSRRFPAGRLPHLRSLQRYLSRREALDAAKLAILRDPDGFRSKYLVALGDADGNIVRVNQLWETDDSITDAKVRAHCDLIIQDRRYTLQGIIDVFSRRLKFHLSPSASSAGTKTLLRKTMLAWGVPSLVMMDNGSNFKSADLQATFQALGIEYGYCNPGSPYEKPFIERAFRTFQHDLVELLPGYVGHNVAERKAVEARAKADGIELVGLSVEDFARFADHWAEHVYGERVHASLGMSPNAKARTCREPLKTIEDPRILDPLLMPLASGKGLRAVQKKGLRVEDAWYWDSGHCLLDWVGRRVRVRMDEGDDGRIYVFDPEDGRFVCEAINLERLGQAERMALAKEARRTQAAWASEIRAEARRLKKVVDPEAIARDLVAAAAGAAKDIIEFPKPHRPLETAATESITVRSRAAAADATRAGLEQRLAATKRAALALAAHAAGASVDAEELRRAQLMAQEPAFRVRVEALQQDGELPADLRLPEPKRRIGQHLRGVA